MTRAILMSVTMGPLFYSKQRRDDTVNGPSNVISSNRPEEKFD